MTELGNVVTISVLPEPLKSGGFLMMNKLLDCLMLVQLVIFSGVTESWNDSGALKNNTEEAEIDKNNGPEVWDTWDTWDTALGAVTS